MFRVICPSHRSTSLYERPKLIHSGPVERISTEYRDEIMVIAEIASLLGYSALIHSK